MQYGIKMNELAPEERTAVERLIGRSLRNDESVQLLVHGPEDARGEQEAVLRASAIARIRELAKGKSIGGATARELIEDG